MFFNIGPEKLDNFPVHYVHKNLVVNLDSGWHETVDQYNNKIFYKGYADYGRLEDLVLKIADQEEPFHTGNFCVLKCFDQGVTIKADRYRSFPIWYDSQLGINNLIPYDETCWTDSFVTILFNLKKVESKFNLIDQIETSYLTFEQVVTKVDNILTTKISSFALNLKEPIKVFLSGGIDTTTLFSYIRKLNVPYELVNCLHTDLDYFYLKNHGDLLRFWGYKQFHYWQEPTILLSGTPGDEFTVRSPTTANMLLKYHQTSIDTLLPNHTNSLHYEYFKQYSTLFDSQKNLRFDSLKKAIFECLNLIVNDYQHWHLGTTISYTPLRDPDIFKTIARLNKNDLIEQTMNSSVQRELIRHNDPQLLSILSTNKNSRNYFENLTKLQQILKIDK